MYAGSEVSFACVFRDIEGTEVMVIAGTGLRRGVSFIRLLDEDGKGKGEEYGMYLVVLSAVKTGADAEEPEMFDVVGAVAGFGITYDLGCVATPPASVVLLLFPTSTFNVHPFLAMSLRSDLFDLSFP